jgi:hypothetical protein
MNNVLQKTKLNTLEDTAVERHHNSTSNRPGIIARLELLIEVFNSSSASERYLGTVEYTYGWYSANGGK